MTDDVRGIPVRMRWQCHSVSGVVGLRLALASQATLALAQMTSFD